MVTPTRKALAFLRVPVLKWDESQHPRGVGGKFGSGGAPDVSRLGRLVTPGGVHEALSHHAQVSRGDADPRDLRTSPETLDLLTRAGALRPTPAMNGGPKGHEITEAGWSMLRGATTLNELHRDVVAEAAANTGKPLPPGPGDPHAGDSPRDPLTPQGGANEPPPRGTRGVKDGKYVLKEPKPSREPTPTPPVELEWKSTEGNLGMAKVFGERMPTLDSLEKVWGDEKSGTTCQITEKWARAGDGKAMFRGNILDRDGEYIGDFERRFIRHSDGSLECHHELFKIEDADKQGGGTGARMLSQAVQAYKQMGVERITTNPAWVGPYAWASMGYEARPDTIKSLQQALVPFLMHHGIPREAAEQHAKDCKALHQFADLNLTPSGERAGPGKPGLYVHHVSSEKNSDGTHPEFDLHLGARFLLSPGGNWQSGWVNLKDAKSTSYQRAHERLGLKP